MLRNLGALVLLIFLWACASDPTEPDISTASTVAVNGEQAQTEELSSDQTSTAQQGTERCDEHIGGPKRVKCVDQMMSREFARRARDMRRLRQSGAR